MTLIQYQFIIDIYNLNKIIIKKKYEKFSRIL